MYRGLLQAANRWMGGSPLGGSPPKDLTSAPEVPPAPNVASRTKPGVVPMKTRGMKR